MKRPTTEPTLLLLLLLLLRPCLGGAASSGGGGGGSRRSVRLVPDGKAAERWRAALAAAARQHRSASSTTIAAADDRDENDDDEAIGGRVAHRRFQQDADFDGIAPLTVAYHRRKRDDDIDNSIAPPLQLLLDQLPAAAKASAARSQEEPRPIVSSSPLLPSAVMAAAAAAGAGVADEWEARPNSGGEDAVAPAQTSPPPHQQNTAALLAAMSRVRLIDHQTGERTHAPRLSSAAATPFADGAPLAVSDQATDLRPELCRTLPMRQAVSHTGCFRRYVSNRMCAGQCNSFFVPSEGVRQQHPLLHRGTSQQQQQQQQQHRQRIVAAAAGDDGEADAVDAVDPPQTAPMDGFSSCTWCKPVKTSTRSVVLFCPHGASLRRQVKRYVVVEQCKCSMHRGAAGEPPIALANSAAAALDYDGQDDQLTSGVVEGPHVAVLESSSS